MRHWLILFLIALPCLAGAVSFNEQVERLPLGQSIDVFEDVRGSADINDITSRAIDSSFRRHDKDVLNAGYSRSVFWLRLDLDYRPVASSDPRTWLLELAYPPLDKLDLYLPDGQGGYRLAQRTGDTLPFASRPIRQNNYLFELGLEPNKPQRVYLRLESQGSIQAPLTLWSPKAYLEEQPERIYVLGIIYGVLLVMLIYNLFIFLSVRDTSYLYYILYIASFGLYQVSVNGAGIEYFWPDSPWWANAATPFLIGSAALFGCQFARSFLHTRDHSVWVDRGLLALMAVGALVMLMALTMSYAVALRLATYLALAFTGLIFAAGILAWLRGMRVARYFIIAWTAFLLGGIVNTLMVLGYLPNMFLTMYASQIGSALEVGLLSLALADRINAMKEERANPPGVQPQAGSAEPGTGQQQPPEGRVPRHRHPRTAHPDERGDRFAGADADGADGRRTRRVPAHRRRFGAGHDADGQRHPRPHRTAGRQALPAPRAVQPARPVRQPARAVRAARRGEGPALRPATGRQPAGYPRR